MNNHTDLLNHLVKKYQLWSYLEIGVQNPANNFDRIKCDYKLGVDPNLVRHDIIKTTSDEYFKECEIDDANKFDLIFIDGLHTAEQVKIDFENSLKCLNDKGFIVLHDTNPAERIHTLVPRESRVWTGDVYKFACTLQEYNNIEYVTWIFDHGCTIVWKSPGKKGTPLSEKITWDWFRRNWEQALNTTTNYDLER